MHYETWRNFLHSPPTPPKTTLSARKRLTHWHANLLHAMHSNDACSRYKDIPGFPVSTVEGHSGRLLFGKVRFCLLCVLCFVFCGLWLVVCGALPYFVLLTCLPCVRRGTHLSASCPAWCIFLFWWMPTPWIDKPSGIVLAYSRSNVHIGSTSRVWRHAYVRYDCSCGARRLVACKVGSTRTKATRCGRLRSRFE